MINNDNNRIKGRCRRNCNGSRSMYVKLAKTETRNETTKAFRNVSPLNDKQLQQWNRMMPARTTAMIDHGVCMQRWRRLKRDCEKLFRKYLTCSAETTTPSARLLWRRNFNLFTHWVSLEWTTFLTDFLKRQVAFILAMLGGLPRSSNSSSSSLSYKELR
jgi:hypothetical protein